MRIGLHDSDATGFPNCGKLEQIHLLNRIGTSRTILNQLRNNGTLRDGSITRQYLRQFQHLQNIRAEKFRSIQCS